MSELQPSLEVYRPVLNISPRMLEVILGTATRANLPTPEISKELHASIISPGELRAAYDHLGYRPEDEELAGLGDYLIDYLPESSEQGISVLTRPIGLHADPRRPFRQIITLGTTDQVVEIERTVAKALFKARYKSPDLVWKESDYRRKVHLGKFGNDREGQQAADFKAFLERHVDLLPSEVELGPVHIADV